MFYPVKMQKIRIYSVKPVIQSLIKELHELGMVEITTAERKGLNGGAPLETYNAISAQLVRVRGIKTNLPKRDTELAEIPDALEEAKGVNIDVELQALYGEIEKLEEDIRKFSDELKITRRLDAFRDIDFSKLETRSTGYAVGVMPRDKINKAQEELSRLGIRHKFLFILLKAEAYVLLIFEKNGGDAGDCLLKYGFNRLDIPHNLVTPEKYAFWLEREIKGRNARINELVSKVEAISDRHYGRIANLEYSLSIAADRAEIASKFSASKSVFVIEGWMEKANLGRLEDLLKKGYQGRASLEPLKPGHHDVAPTVLENEKAVGPYQFLTTSFSFPNANEIDPSIIYFFTVPLLYGMIVADVVYGTISIFLALFFMKKFKDSEIMSSVSRLWLFSAIPAILFGFVFDEFAGMTHYHLLEKLFGWGVINAHAMGITGPLYTGLSRLEDLTMLFQVTLLVGMIHIALGLVMGAINEWGHSKKHALGKLAWIGVEVGGYLAVATFMFNAMPLSWGEAGAGLLVLSALVIAWVEGVVGVLELPGIASNVFSYVRIAVVGVVGTILAELINAIFMPVPAQGIMALIFFPLFIGLHILNAFIAMFEAVIQGGRLNIIEFKLKFLKGGGRPFRPFALSDKL